MNAVQETVFYIKAIMAAAFSPSVGKVIYATILVAYMFLFDVTKSDLYLALLILIGLDFVTSLWAAKISGEPIQSSKIGHTAIKVFAYYVVICGAFLTEKGLFAQISVLDETVIAFYLGREFVSLLENVGRMGYPGPQKLLNQVRDKLKTL